MSPLTLWWLAPPLLGATLKPGQITAVLFVEKAGAKLNTFLSNDVPL